MGGGSSKSKVEAGPRMNYRKQGTGVSALSRLDSNTIVDKLRLHRKNIPEDLNDGMKETDFVVFLLIFRYSSWHMAFRGGTILPPSTHSNEQTQKRAIVSKELSQGQ